MIEWIFFCFKFLDKCVYTLSDVWELIVLLPGKKNSQNPRKKKIHKSREFRKKITFLFRNNEEKIIVFFAVFIRICYAVILLFSFHSSIIIGHFNFQYMLWVSVRMAELRLFYTVARRGRRRCCCFFFLFQFFFECGELI